MWTSDELMPSSVLYKYPVPRVDDTLDLMNGSIYFSTLDLFAGYHQTPMEKKSIKFTTFTCNLGTFAYQKLPFGLACAPMYFQEVMDEVLSGLKWHTCIVYIDDIIVFGKSLEEHNTRLRQVLERLDEYKFKLNPKKCKFLQERVQFLGHEVSAEGIRPNLEKIEVIRQQIAPHNLKALQRFLGMVGFYQKFINNYAGTARPLYDLLKKGTKFTWRPSQEEAFNVLREALTKDPILRYFDPDKEVFLHTDASDTAVGCVVKQDGFPIAYSARTLHGPELNYTVQEKECLAIIEAVRKHYQYLGQPFAVVTDHHSLCYLMRTKDHLE